MLPIRKLVLKHIKIT